MENKSKFKEVVMLTHPFFISPRKGNIDVKNFLEDQWIKEAKRVASDPSKALVVTATSKLMENTGERERKLIFNKLMEIIPRDRLFIEAEYEGYFESFKLKERVTKETKITAFGEKLYLPRASGLRKGCVPFYAEELADRFNIPRKNIEFKSAISEPALMSKKESIEAAKRIKISGGKIYDSGIKIKRTSRESILEKIKKARKH